MCDLIKDIVERILEENSDLESLPSDFAKGKRLAYYEVLDMINNRLEILGYDPSAFGLVDDPFILINSN